MLELEVLFDWCATLISREYDTCVEMRQPAYIYTWWIHVAIVITGRAHSHHPSARPTPWHGISLRHYTHTVAALVVDQHGNGAAAYGRGRWSTATSGTAFRVQAKATITHPSATN